MGEHLPCKQGVMGSNPIISILWETGKSHHELARDLRKQVESYGLIAQQVRARA